MANDLIEKRDERTRKRKKIKRKMDSIIGLSYHDKDKKVLSASMDVKMLSNDTARLLDEGFIDNGFVIKKGAMEKYLNGQNQYVRGWEMGDDGEWTQTEVLNLTPDFEGTVNLGHLDFSIFPFILGHFRQEDLKLTDMENGRHALDVQLHLDEESMFVKELRRQPFDIGLSAEFWVHENVEDTRALSETLGYYLPVFDEIFIFAYGLVGECGNVNSSGLELKGATMPNDINEVMTVENDEIETENDEIELAGVTEVTDEAAEPAEDASEAVETAEEQEVITEAIEVAEEVAPVECADGEEVTAEETVEGDSDEGEDDEAGTEEDVLAEALSIIHNLNEQIAQLTSRITELTEVNDELKKSNRRLQGKLKVEKDKKEKFLESAKGLSVELFPNEGEDIAPKKEKANDEAAAMRRYIYGDGIGDE